MAPNPVELMIRKMVTCRILACLQIENSSDDWRYSRPMTSLSESLAHRLWQNFSPIRHGCTHSKWGALWSAETLRWLKRRLVAGQAYLKRTWKLLKRILLGIRMTPWPTMKSRTRTGLKISSIGKESKGYKPSNKTIWNYLNTVFHVYMIISKY